MTTTWSGSSSSTAPGNGQGAAWGLSSGNLTASFTPSGVTSSVTSTGALASGKWYWEVVANAIGSGMLIGIIKSGDDINTFLGHSANGYGYKSDGNLANNNATAGYGNSYTTNDVIGVAYDATNGNLWFSKNGTWQASATIAEIAAGTTTHAAKTGLSGTFYPAIGNNSTTGTAVTGSLRVNTTTVTQAVPSGYQPLDAAAISMTASPLSYAFTLSSITGKLAWHLAALPISYAFTLTTNVMHYGRYLRALPISFAFSLVATILAAVVQPASKLKRRITDPILTKLRVTDPALGD